MSLRRGIPSLTALQAFEASARHQSFSKAAAELGQTHGAICKKVNELEADLDIALFDRISQRLVLTNAGADYARRVRVHLEQIRQDTHRLRSNNERATLQVAVGVTFGAQWLVPRLPDFYRAHPQIQLRLTGRDQPTYFQDLHFDAAIHFGQTQLPGFAHKVLIANDEIWMVAAPSLATADVLASPWIHCRDLSAAWANWSETFDGSAGATGDVHSGSDYFFDFFIMAIHAAVAGLGLALLPRLLIENELRNGTLVRVGDYGVRNAEKAYLSFPEHKRDWVPLATFGNWLETAMSHYQNAWVAPEAEAVTTVGNSA